MRALELAAFDDLDAVAGAGGEVAAGLAGQEILAPSRRRRQRAGALSLQLCPGVEAGPGCMLSTVIS
jgi:hypothetical protein